MSIIALIRSTVYLNNTWIVSSCGLFNRIKFIEISGLYESRKRISCKSNLLLKLGNTPKQVGLGLGGANQWQCLPVRKPFTMLGMPLHGNMFSRMYTTGELTELWAAVTGGRKGKVRKKGRSDSIQSTQGVEDKTKFGGAKITFLGLNAPIQQGNASIKGESHQRERPHKKRMMTGLRGWSGSTWPGRHAGPPQNPNKELLNDLDSIVVQVKKVSTMTPNGRKRTVSALVVVGNGNGAVGWAEGNGQTAISAIIQARNKAANYLYTIPICDGHTIYHDIVIKQKTSVIRFERKPTGYGLRCQRIIKAVAELGGIKDMRCKLLGPTTPVTVLQTIFQGLMMQETHQDLAERKGKYVVEFRQEMGMRPTVVASPSEEAIFHRLNEEQMTEGIEDVTTAFDPYKGLHTPKLQPKSKFL